MFYRILKRADIFKTIYVEGICSILYSVTIDYNTIHWASKYNSTLMINCTHYLLQYRTSECFRFHVSILDALICYRTHRLHVIRIADPKRQNRVQMHARLSI